MSRINVAIAGFCILLVTNYRTVAAEIEFDEGSEEPAVEFADSQVIELTDADFDEKVKDGMETPWFVKFYAPWCGHCKSLAPAWEELGSVLKGKVNVARVDATTQKTLAEQFGIQGFPTLYLISQGKMYSYEGNREVHEMSKWATDAPHHESMSPLPKKLTTLDRVLKAIQKLPEPVFQVHQFVPWLMPLVFVCGSFWGFLLTSFFGGRPKVPKELNTFYKVHAVRNPDNKSAGLEIDALRMTIQKVEENRPELSDVQIGDTIIEVNGTSIVDADDYRRNAHGKDKFVLKLGRSTGGKHKEKDS